MSRYSQVGNPGALGLARQGSPRFAALIRDGEGVWKNMAFACNQHMPGCTRCVGIVLGPNTLRQRYRGQGRPRGDPDWQHLAPTKRLFAAVFRASVPHRAHHSTTDERPSPSSVSTIRCTSEEGERVVLAGRLWVCDVWKLNMMAGRVAPCAVTGTIKQESKDKVGRR